MTELVLIDQNGKRSDNRGIDDLRQIKITVGGLKNADGSAYIEFGKNKIIVTEGDRNIRFEWPEVKSLKIIPYLNLYKLKLKGKRGYIYFFPSQNIDPAFGLLSKDTSKMGDIVQKRKKELGIK